MKGQLGTFLAFLNCALWTFDPPALLKFQPWVCSLGQTCGADGLLTGLDMLQEGATRRQYAALFEGTDASVNIPLLESAYRDEQQILMSETTLRVIRCYAGLLTCKECGNPFIPMIRYWNGNRRVEYVCRGYHRNGKNYCTSHRIHEEVLDAAVQEYAEAMREQCAEELKKLAQMQEMWALRKQILDAHILLLQEKVHGLEQEIDEIMMEKITRQ